MKSRDLAWGAASLILAVTVRAQTTQTAAETKEQPIAEVASGLLPASKDGAIKLKGYVQGRYSSYDEAGKSDGFTVKSAYIVPHGIIAPDWFFEAEIDAADSSGKVLRNGFIEYTGFGPRARIRAGQQKPFYAEEFWTSSSAIDTIDRSKAVTSLSAERDIGVNLLGKAAGDRVEYGLGVFNGSGINTADADDGKDVAGRVVFAPFKGAGTAAEGLRFGGGAWGGGDASVQLVGKYESYEPNKDVADDNEDVVTVGANLFFNKYAKLMLNYKFKNEDKEVDNDEVIAQLQVRF